MIPVIFEFGLNNVIKENGEKINKTLPLYYWKKSLQQFINAGTLNSIKDNSIDIQINITDNNNIIEIGNIDNASLYYNSTPDIPIVHIPPIGAEKQPEPKLIKLKPVEKEKAKTKPASDKKVIIMDIPIVHIPPIGAEKQPVEKKAESKTASDKDYMNKLMFTDFEGYKDKKRKDYIDELTELFRDDILDSDLYKMIMNTHNHKERIQKYTFDDLQKDKYYIEHTDEIISDDTITNEIKFLDQLLIKYINYISDQLNIYLKSIGIFYEDNKNKIYYSAYPENMTIDKFKSKNSIWISERLDQAILHPLNVSINSPVIFEFKLNNFFYLSSTDKNNTMIFSRIFPRIDEKLLKHINDKNMKNSYLSPQIVIEQLYTNDANKFILYILDVISKIIPPDIFNIAGYMNLLDQYEIGLLHFDNLVNSSSIIKYQYTKIVFNNGKSEIIFPLLGLWSNIKHLSNNSIKVMYDNKYTDSRTNETSTYDKYRMICIGNLQIYYKRVIESGPDGFTGRTDSLGKSESIGLASADSLTKSESVGLVRADSAINVDNLTRPNTNEIVFDCSILTKEDIFKNKYFKYKNKYLQLKNK